MRDDTVAGRDRLLGNPPPDADSAVHSNPDSVDRGNPTLRDRLPSRGLGIACATLTALASIATVVVAGLGIAGCYPEQVTRAAWIVAAFTVFGGLIPGVVLLPFAWNRTTVGQRRAALIVPALVLVVYGLITCAWVLMLAGALSDARVFSALLALLAPTVAVFGSAVVMSLAHARWYARVAMWLGLTTLLTVAGVAGVFWMASGGKCG